MKNSFWQVVRFSIVGVSNTAIDVLVLNILLWKFPTQNAYLLLSYNSLAFASGALNSYVFNKYWTFRHRQTSTNSELLRFATVNGVGFLCNNGILWIAASILHPALMNTTLWANGAKLSAVVGTAMVTYLGMRLWVFTHSPITKRENGEYPERSQAPLERDRHPATSTIPGQPDPCWSADATPRKAEGQREVLQKEGEHACKKIFSGA